MIKFVYNSDELWTLKEGRKEQTSTYCVMSQPQLNSTTSSSLLPQLDSTPLLSTFYFRDTLIKLSSIPFTMLRSRILSKHLIQCGSVRSLAASTTSGRKNIVLIDGVRTPFLNSGTDYADVMAYDLQRNALL